MNDAKKHTNTLSRNWKTKPMIMIVVITFSLRVKNQLSTQVIGNFEVEIKREKNRIYTIERKKRMKEETVNRRGDVCNECVWLTAWMDGSMDGWLAVCLPAKMERW